MKKILKGLAKYVAFTILLACFLPLSLQHVQADEDEVEYSLLPMLVTFQFMMMVMRRLVRK